MNTPPRNDAAPLAGGAGVNGPNTSPDSTFARLPLMPPVRNDAPETSRVGEHGATDQEIQDALQLPSNTEIPRRWELVNAGAVVASGRKRKTRSNRPATVWVLSEFAPKPEGVKP